MPAILIIVALFVVAGSVKSCVNWLTPKSELELAQERADAAMDELKKAWRIAHRACESDLFSKGVINAPYVEPEWGASVNGNYIFRWTYGGVGLVLRNGVSGIGKCIYNPKDDKVEVAWAK